MTNDSKELISAITTSATQLAVTLCIPEFSAPVAIASPLIQNTISRCLGRFVKGDIDRLDDIDKAKLGFAYYSLCDYVATMESRNRKLRECLTREANENYSKIDSYMAALINGVVKDKEDSKATAYGRVMGELFFSSDIQDNSLVHIIEPVFELTMDDIEVLCYFIPETVSHFGKLDSAVQSSHTMDDHILYHCLSHLLSLGILVRVAPCSSTKHVENVRLSPIGILLKDILSPIAPHTSLEQLYNQYCE